MLDSRSQSSSLQKCEIWIWCVNHPDSEAILQGSSLISQMGQFKHHLKKKITGIDQNRANTLTSVSSKWSLKQNKMKHNQRNLYQSPLQSMREASCYIWLQRKTIKLWSCPSYINDLTESLNSRNRAFIQVSQLINKTGKIEYNCSAIPNG